MASPGVPELAPEGGQSYDQDRKGSDEPNPIMLGELRRMSVGQAVVNNVAFMAVPAILPSLFAKTGWTTGVLFTTYSAVLTYFTGIILGEICAQRPHLHSYPLIAEEALRTLCGSNKELARKSARIARTALNVLQFLCYYLVGIAELVYVEQYMALLFHNMDLCQRSWLLITGALVWPFTQIPTFKDSVFVAAIALVLHAFMVSVFVYQLAAVQPWSCDPGPERPRPTYADVVYGITGIAYAFGGHGLFPENIREMAEPSRWKSVMKWMYGICVPVYMAMGLFGYAAYGQNAKANINLNYPDNWPNRASVIAQCLTEFYIVAAASLLLTLKVEIYLDVSPNHWWKVPEYAENPKQSESEDSCSTTDSESSAPRGRWWRASAMPPALFRLLWRTAFLGSQVAVAYIMLGGDGDILLTVQSLAGALGFIAMTYFMPLLFGYALLPKVGTARFAFYGLSFVFCTAIMFVGVWKDAKSLVESAGGLSSDVVCKINVDEYSSDGCIAALGSHA